jgi:hypothetical protein
MSELKVNKLSPRSGTDITLGNSGTDFIVPSGATITVNSGGQIVNNGTSEGFGIAWQAVTTAATLTTIAGKGYPINTTSNACTVTLPSSASVGDQVQIVDYAGTFATNNITLTSSLNIEGGANDKVLTTNREGVIITYVDVTQGWVASSGVNSGDQALDPITYSADILVVAGGGSGGGNAGGDGAGGGGAGGYRTSTQTLSQSSVYTITVGDGGASVGAAGSPVGNSGSNSSISGSGIITITSAGGGGGGRGVSGDGNGLSGGSGGGAGYNGTGGTGNTPSTSPVQGFAGGNNNTSNGGTGGGGASAVGTAGSGADTGTTGGAGSASSITGSSVTYAGGGGGGSYIGAVASGGSGGGGNGGGGAAVNVPATSGTTNLGGGGGGGGTTNGIGAAGGKGVVILSVPTANYSSTTTGSPTVTTSGANTILSFTGSGSYTA